MAESHWLAQRAQTLQHTCTDPDTGAITDDKKFSLYMRYYGTHTRAFHQFLNQLLKLRSERRKSETGFEAQKIANEKHEIKKAAHPWDLLKKDFEVHLQLGDHILKNIQAKRKIRNSKRNLPPNLKNAACPNAKTACQYRPPPSAARSTNARTKAKAELCLNRHRKQRELREHRTRRTLRDLQPHAIRTDRPLRPQNSACPDARAFVKRRPVSVFQYSTAKPPMRWPRAIVSRNRTRSKVTGRGSANVISACVTLSSVTQ